MSKKLGAAMVIVGSLGLFAVGGPAWCQEEEQEELPYYLADRGTGIPTSLFGTYVEKGQLLVYPFYEYTKNTSAEYKPSELGYEGNMDFLGTEIEQEYLLFFAYGVTENLAIELEGAVYTKATLEKPADEPSDVPAKIEESGIGDVETQLRYRWKKEGPRRPELFSFLKVVFPFQKNEVLIGTQDWEVEAGFGAIRGFRWGTLTGRFALLYEAAANQFEVGEYAIEYLNRTSPHWRFVASLEGEDDEVSIIGEAQWIISRRVMLKLNSGFGITKKAPDYAPEIGILFTF